MAEVAAGQDFQTLEGWCEEAVRRWNQTLSGSGEDEGQEARRFKAVSYTVRFLLAVILLCVAAAACAGYRLQDIYQACRIPAAPATPVPEEELAPRSGLLLLVIGLITVFQLAVIILVANCCAGPRSKEAAKRFGDGFNRRHSKPGSEQLNLKYVWEVLRICHAFNFGCASVSVFALF
ncbi:unnamed protein product [Symbiodinium sp. CCMP2592]|nr:unnamed protein product [Symbiodinium sp. CCMP2592]